MLTWSCGNNIIEDTIDYFTVPFVAFGIFMVLFSPCVYNHFIDNIPSSNFRLISIAFVIFIFVYITDRLVSNWRFQKIYNNKRKSRRN